eukprot:4392811-Amphidinium_carterae.1
MVDSYRTIPSRQLSSTTPATDLRERITGEFLAQLAGTSGQGSDLKDLIPAAMTSKLWWIKMKDIVKKGTQGGPSAGVPD